MGGGWEPNRSPPPRQEISTAEIRIRGKSRKKVHQTKKRLQSQGFDNSNKDLPIVRNEKGKERTDLNFQGGDKNQ
jgi:hypothetical protein